MEKVDLAGRLSRGVSPAAVESIEMDIFQWLAMLATAVSAPWAGPGRGSPPDKAVSVNFNAKLNADTPAQDHAAFLIGSRVMATKSFPFALNPK